jgi:2-succinyl-5-enolpyruvyl-6-hydroxy-3-cyclohexene-1-carboxylate synthase
MTAKDTYLLLRALCDELARCGLEQACTSPGSRCTPLVLSLAREPRIRCWSHIDERCAGFFALGAAKTTGRPVVVTCTSGTAAVNLHPAVVEAWWAGVPLLVLTADRPAELRDIGAGQAIDQLKLYGGAVKWFFEVELGAATRAALRWVRTLACRAFSTALSARPGPVHLNFPLREPLVFDGELPEDPTARADGQPYVVSMPPGAPAPPGVSGPVDLCERPVARAARRAAGADLPRRPVIVAGAGTADPEGLAAFAARAGIPLLADPPSHARRGAAAIAHYDLLLREESFAAAHRPDCVLRIGALPTSKPLRAWLASLAPVPQVAADPQDRWQDPDAVVRLRLRGPLAVPQRLAVDPHWLAGWRRADAAAAGAIEAALGEGLSEPKVARLLGGLLDGATTLVIASSMPIRDAESFFPASTNPPRVLANRGANGIDGTVSFAFGAAATGARVVLLTGDVAMAHDIGGLLAARRLGLAATIVLLNNDGGAIFHFLPVADERDAFEEHVATPHGLDFAHAAALYACEHVRVGDEAELAAAIAPASVTRIVEIRTDRRENLALHGRVAAAVAAALRASGSRR